MKVAFHLGVHGTDQDKLVRALLQNRDLLSRRGTEVPSPTRYRSVLGEALNSLNGAPASDQMQEFMLDAFVDSDELQRLILSQPGFLGLPYRAISAEGLYVTAPDRLRALANLFPSAEVEFFIALKNPATLVPFVVSQIADRSFEQVMQGIDPMQLRWSPAMRRILQAAQSRRVVVWCNEDAPLIWPEVLRRIADIPAEQSFKGGMQILYHIMSPEGIAWLREQLPGDGELPIAERRALTEQALERFALTDRLSQDLSCPGWTQDLVDRISETYDRDVAEIAALPGVEFIAP